MVYKEEDTGLLLGRSQWGIFRADPTLYPESWENGTEMSLAREVAECEEILKARAVPGDRVNPAPGKKPSRYVPVRVRRLLEDMYDGFCGLPGCNDRIYQTHHPLRLLYQVRAIDI